VRGLRDRRRAAVASAPGPRRFHQLLSFLAFPAPNDQLLSRFATSGFRQRHASVNTFQRALGARTTAAPHFGHGRVAAAVGGRDDAGAGQRLCGRELRSGKAAAGLNFRTVDQAYGIIVRPASRKGLSTRHAAALPMRHEQDDRREDASRRRNPQTCFDQVNGRLFAHEWEGRVRPCPGSARALSAVPR